MSTTRLTTAQAIVQFLSQQYSERDGNRQRLIPGMFGIFGHGNVAGLGQALEEFGDGLPYIQGRNEQSMVHAAIGYAKAAVRLSTFACTTSIGPGSTNMVTGAALATINRLPVLLFPSDTYATRRQGPVLQQLQNPQAGDITVNDTLRPVVRFFDRITRPEQLITALPEAMRVLTSVSETGAVAICLPQDIQSEAYDFPASFFETLTWPVARPPAEQGAVERVASMIAEAKRPLVIAGGGVIYSEAQEELDAFSDALNIPVAETFAGKGSMQAASWRTLGGIGLEGNPATNEIAAKADLVISIGTRLTDFVTGSHSLFQAPGVRFASINVSGHDSRRLGATAIVADAREAMSSLREEAIKLSAGADDSYRQEVEVLREAWTKQRAAALDEVRDDGAITQARLIGEMNRLAEPGDTIIAAAGGPPGDLLKTWDATGGRNCHLEFGFSCMGYEIPAALGVRLAQANGQVIAFVGDGTFLMNPTEIVTMLQEGASVTVVISENHGFQVIRRLQMLRAGTSFGNEFRHREGSRLLEGRLEGDYLKLDLGLVAEGLGAAVFRVSSDNELRETLEKARAVNGPAVVVVETVPHSDLPSAGVWWDVAPPETSSNEAARRLRSEYEADRERLQRHYG